MSEYERMRQENIRRNNEFFAGLNLSEVLTMKFTLTCDSRLIFEVLKVYMQLIQVYVHLSQEPFSQLACLVCITVLVIQH